MACLLSYTGNDVIFLSFSFIYRDICANPIPDIAPIFHFHSFSRSSHSLRYQKLNSVWRKFKSSHRYPSPFLQRQHALNVPHPSVVSSLRHGVRHERRFRAGVQRHCASRAGDRDRKSDGRRLCSIFRLPRLSDAGGLCHVDCGVGAVEEHEERSLETCTGCLWSVGAGDFGKL